jgi:hypothetical protein
VIVGIPPGKLLDTPARALVVVVLAVVAGLVAWGTDTLVHLALGA